MTQGEQLRGGDGRAFSDRAVHIDSHRQPRTRPRAIARRLAQTPPVMRSQHSDDVRFRYRVPMDATLLAGTNGVVLTAGFDEVGMGPIAGPVTAAAVIFGPTCSVVGLRA